MPLQLPIDRGVNLLWNIQYLTGSAGMAEYFVEYDYVNLKRISGIVIRREKVKNNFWRKWHYPLRETKHRYV